MSKLSSKDILVRGSALGAILAVPTVVVFLGLWAATGELIMPAIVGAVVHFVSLGFSVKIAKKLLVKRDPVE